MRVAIIGAGMAGLAAGRTLRAGGAQAVLFEKSRGPGGRLATRRDDPFVWDTGATGLALAEGPLRELVIASGAEVIQRPVWLQDELVPRSGDPDRLPRYAHAEGFRAVTASLAEGLDVRTGVEIEAIARDGAGFLVDGERWDAVILTPPLPQTSRLLWTIGEARPLGNARYRACVSVSLGYRSAPTPDVPYHALLSRTHEVGWISIESLKVAGRAPTGGSAFTLQLSERASLAQFALPDADLVQRAADALARLYGAAFTSPDAATVMRWKYSQPVSVAANEGVNPPGTRLLIAGDGVSASKAPDAWNSGVAVAQRLLSPPPDL